MRHSTESINLIEQLSYDIKGFYIEQISNYRKDSNYGQYSRTDR